MDTYPLLACIETPEDLRSLDRSSLEQLAHELRSYIIEIVSGSEGHLGASLGVVELTIALHYVYQTPIDQLVWDVGHQAYGHKILTGRREAFKTNRQYQGISGFPKRSESIYDTFGTGHSSTAISAALGMALASGLKGDLEKRHVAVVGDASIASGMAFEALNHAGVSDANLLIILNDNAIGIDPSVGALKAYLTRVKEGKNTHQTNIIKALNFAYHGPVDGHDLEGLIAALQHLRTKKGPQFLHITTTKGKGLRQAEIDQVRYHAPGKFDKYTGDLLPKDESLLPPKFQDVFGHTLVELADMNPAIVGITPAMPTGSSMKFLMDAYPNRAFDVGIAEQHAVTLAAGMACNNLIPFCNIYSTFAQRAYDQIIHDVALQNLSVVFCLDRAGLVGQDGATHHGAFDIAFLRCIPQMTLAIPRNEIELRNLLYTAQLRPQGPMAIRYPRGRGEVTEWQKPFSEIPIGKGERIKEGSQVAVIAVGPMCTVAQKAIQLSGVETSVGLFDLRFVKPIDTEMLLDIFSRYQYIITLEDGCVKGGMGSAVTEFAQDNKKSIPIKILGLPDRFMEHGTVDELRREAGLSEDQLAELFRFIVKSLN